MDQRLSVWQSTGKTAGADHGGDRAPAVLEPANSGSSPNRPEAQARASKPSKPGPVPPVLPTAAPSRCGRFWWPALVLVFGLGLAVIWHFDPARHGFYPRCTFHELTGWQCPGCGGLRSVHALLHGRWAESWHYNPIPLLTLPLMAGAALVAWWRRKGGSEFRWDITPTLVWTALLALVAFGVLRNLR
jgi:hypothetical protein